MGGENNNTDGAEVTYLPTLTPVIGTDVGCVLSSPVPKRVNIQIDYNGQQSLMCAPSVHYNEESVSGRWNCASDSFGCGLSSETSGLKVFQSLLSTSVEALVSCTTAGGDRIAFHVVNDQRSAYVEYTDSVFNVKFDCRSLHKTVPCDTNISNEGNAGMVTFFVTATITECALTSLVPAPKRVNLQINYSGIRNLMCAHSVYYNGATAPGMWNCAGDSSGCGLSSEASGTRVLQSFLSPSVEAQVSCVTASGDRVTFNVMNNQRGAHAIYNNNGFDVEFGCRNLYKTVPCNGGISPRGMVTFFVVATISQPGVIDGCKDGRDCEVLNSTTVTPIVQVSSTSSVTPTSTTTQISHTPTNKPYTVAMVLNNLPCSNQFIDQCSGDEENSEKSYVLPVIVFSGTDLRSGLKICSTTFNQVHDPDYSYIILVPEAFNDSNCVPVSFEGYLGSGYQSFPNVDFYSNLTGTQIFAVSFNITSLSFPPDGSGSECFSFQDTNPMHQHESEALERAFLEDDVFLIDNNKTIGGFIQSWNHVSFPIFQNTSGIYILPPDYALDKPNREDSIVPIDKLCQPLIGCTEVEFNNVSIDMFPASCF